MRSRFSPACAGNGIADLEAWTGTPVQPRVRGERRIAKVLAGIEVGSAPRARGTGARQMGGARLVRFSPACAGNGTSTS